MVKTDKTENKEQKLEKSSKNIKKFIFKKRKQKIF